MNKFELVHFDDSDALAKSAAEKMLRFVSAREKTSLCLSGGRITVKLFHELCAQCQNKAAGCRALLKSTDYFWADERCVSPSDSESNFGIARRQFFTALNIAPERIHQIQGETDPAVAAQMAEAELCRIAPLNREGIPIIDLLLLGMGEDGHVASLFPGQVAESAWAEAIYHPVVGPKPPPNRVTLGYRTIAAAAEVWVLVSGGGKESVLQRALAGDSSIPLGRIISERSRTLILANLKPL